MTQSAGAIVERERERELLVRVLEAAKIREVDICVLLLLSRM